MEVVRSGGTITSHIGRAGDEDIQGFKRASRNADCATTTDASQDGSTGNQAWVTCRIIATFALEGSGESCCVLAAATAISKEMRQWVVS